MAASVHPSAVVDQKARLADGVVVGPFSYIGPDVEIGADTFVGPHCSVQGPTRIGSGNRFIGHCAVGGDPQDKKFHGEHTELVIGDGNTFREFVTLNRGTGPGGGCTRVGNDNWMLAYAHVAHDCTIGDHCILSNNATLAGHVSVGDHVILSGFAGVHQFCRVGSHAFVGMGAFVNGDVPPFVMVAQEDYGRPRGINAEGLKRRGFSAERITAIKRAYRALYVAAGSMDEARARLAELAVDSDDVRLLLEFLRSGDRPLLR